MSPDVLSGLRSPRGYPPAARRFETARIKSHREQSHVDKRERTRKANE